MPYIFSSSLQWFRDLSRTRIIIGIIVLLVVAIAGLFFWPKTPTHQFVTVSQGPITETVSVIGNTTPISSVSLGFGNSGTIAGVYASVGKVVRRGQVLAELNASDLYAQVQQAQANVATQQATFDKARQDLANMYASITDTAVDSYAKANDDVRVQLNQSFSNSEITDPKLTYIVGNFEAQNDAERERQSVTYALNTWQTQLATSDQSTVTLDAVLKDGPAYLAVIRQLLNSVSKTLDNTPALSATTLASYKANVTTALNEVNTASKNLNSASQNIASQKLTVAQLQTQIESAQAAVQSAKAKLQNSLIIAPISGIITEFDAKVGQFASPGLALVSIISSGPFEIDTLVSETDVGKISLNNAVTMTLDAFPNETFTGSVFYIDPAQTTTEGVVGYQIKVTEGTADPRMKSGLTVNLDITTRHKDNVLILPQYAVLQNDKGTFVEVLQNGTVKDVPVTLGLQDQNGNIEIVSGVSAGEQVLNIGLKQK